MFGGNNDVTPLYIPRVLRLGQCHCPMPSFAGSALHRRKALPDEVWSLAVHKLTNISDKGLNLPTAAPMRMAQIASTSARCRCIV